MDKLPSDILFWSQPCQCGVGVQQVRDGLCLIYKGLMARQSPKRRTRTPCWHDWSSENTSLYTVDSKASNHRNILLLNKKTWPIEAKFKFHVNCTNWNQFKFKCARSGSLCSIFSRGHKLFSSPPESRPALRPTKGLFPKRREAHRRLQLVQRQNAWSYDSIPLFVFIA
jgi:hypothetical protein